jgi:hypothetical protein
MTDFSQLNDLFTLELAERIKVGESRSKIILSNVGIEVSDTIGAWLYSPQVTALMESYQWR